MTKLINYLKLARFHQPTGIWLLFLPVFFSILISYKALLLRPNFIFPLIELFKIIAIFFIGAVLTRSAGCVINDIFDAKFDQKVARTKSRPIAAGLVSKSEALIFAVILLLGALFILLHLNNTAIAMGFFASLLMLVYPLTKRFTYFPQIFLGFTFNFGVLIACIAVYGKFHFGIFFIYLAAIIWTLIYDTIYAFQDLEDDLKIGVKSTTMIFSKAPTRIFFILLFLMFLLFVFAGIFAKFNVDYFFFVGLAHFLLGRKIFLCDFKNSQNCQEVFKFNVLFGLLILAGIILQ